MPSNQQVEGESFSKDIREFVRLLAIYDVRYMIVGGEAVIYYGHARFTGDVDFFYKNDDENSRHLFAALSEFWDGRIPGLQRPEELLENGLILQFGRPPNRIDLINQIDGVTFEEAWPSKLTVSLRIGDEFYPLHYIGLTALIVNKEAAGRPKDMDDLRYLRALTT